MIIICKFLEQNSSMTIICKFLERNSSSIGYDMDIPNSSPLFRTWYTAVSNKFVFLILAFSVLVSKRK